MALRRRLSDGRHLTVHMVMPEGDGLVTVIYVVDRKSSQRRLPA
jgi:hypothetical protein